MNGYELSRRWFDFAFENPEKVNPNHHAIYFFAIEHNNRLGWRNKFGFPTQMAMDAIGIKKHQTYIRYFNDLVGWGFFILVQKSTNQYSANIISLVNAIPKNGKALDKAIITHATKQTEPMGQSNSSIDKPLTNKQDNHKPFFPPSEKNDRLDFGILLDFIKKTTGRNFQTINQNVRNKFTAGLKEGYTKETIRNAILNAVKQTNHRENGNQFLTPEFFSRQATLDKYGTSSAQIKKTDTPNSVKMTFE